MLHVSHLSKSYGIATILDDVSFVLNRGEHAGLVGVNGAGKTTLLRIIAGLEPPDAGFARLDAHATLGYLPQGLVLDDELALDALIRQGVAMWETARCAMNELAARLERDAARPDANEGSTVKSLAEYGAAVARFEALGGYDVETRIEDVLRGLGLENVARDLPIGKLSGGQRTRAELARLLVSEPSVLLLDEPTNHLDVAALEWLEEFIHAYAGAALIVSHDRVFLDHTVSQILELDDVTHRVTIYHGNYSDYEGAKARELEQQWSAYQDQQAELARLTDAARHLRGIAKFRKGGKADTNDKFAKAFFANRGKATVGRAKNIEKRIERLQTDEKIDKPKAGYALKLDFGEMPRSGQMVLQLEEVGHSFDVLRLTNDERRETSNVKRQVSNVNWLFRNVNAMLRHGERIALVGANGTGKSTLLKIIVGELQPTAGRVRLGANVRLGYMPQEQETLDVSTTPLAMVRALMPVGETDARHFLHFFMFERDEVFTPIGKLSYGERARLILAKLVAERSNVLILDEPINHLDIPSRERFQAALDAFPGTILVAVHDRAFIERFASGIWAIEKQTLRAYE
ncbi:MAG: ABC-F family ATP-binding cassette domain-containing protein [Chloroflexi bacterium]|nr:ABC-F family ATP-binding cassette domain-containing protein [Chloroflexota bacterium]